MTSNHLYKIILADDHALVRKGIRKVIEEDANLQVIGEAGDGLELLEILEEIQPSRTWSFAISPCPGSGVWRPACGLRNFIPTLRC